MTIHILIVTFVTTLFIQEGVCQGLLPPLFPEPPGLLPGLFQFIQNVLRLLFGGLFGGSPPSFPFPFPLPFPLLPPLFPGLFGFPFAFLQFGFSQVLTTLLRIVEQLLTGSPNREGLFQETIESLLPKPSENDPSPGLPPFLNFLSSLFPENNPEPTPIPQFILNLFPSLNPQNGAVENPLQPPAPPNPIQGQPISTLPGYFYRNCLPQLPLPLQLPFAGQTAS